jgi:hypothetical protein
MFTLLRLQNREVLCNSPGVAAASECSLTSGPHGAVGRERTKEAAEAGWAAKRSAAKKA